MPQPSARVRGENENLQHRVERLALVLRVQVGELLHQQLDRLVAIGLRIGELPALAGRLQELGQHVGACVLSVFAVA